MPHVGRLRERGGHDVGFGRRGAIRWPVRENVVKRRILEAGQAHWRRWLLLAAAFGLLALAAGRLGELVTPTW